MKVDEQKYRILAELPNGHVRYESMHGVQTGRQVGRFIVRDNALLLATGKCPICGESFADREVYVIDCLDQEIAVAGFMRFDLVMLAADIVSARGRTEEVGMYFAEMCHWDHTGEQGQPFNQWRSGVGFA